MLSEMECLFDLLSGGMKGNQQPKNKEHFVLATADPVPMDTKTTTRGRPKTTVGAMGAAMGDDIRVYVREIPGVPIIYVKRSVMVLEELSKASLGVRMREEKDKFRGGLLGAGSRKRKRDDNDDDHDGGEDADGKNEGAANAAAPPKKKKSKKIKGPNPLSVMKKKKRPPKPNV